MPISRKRFYFLSCVVLTEMSTNKILDSDKYKFPLYTLSVLDGNGNMVCRTFALTVGYHLVWSWIAGEVRIFCPY